MATEDRTVSFPMVLPYSKVQGEICIKIHVQIPSKETVNISTNLAFPSFLPKILEEVFDQALSNAIYRGIVYANMPEPQENIYIEITELQITPKRLIQQRNKLVFETAQAIENVISQTVVDILTYIT